MYFTWCRLEDLQAVKKSPTRCRDHNGRLRRRKWLQKCRVGCRRYPAWPSNLHRSYNRESRLQNYNLMITLHRICPLSMIGWSRSANQRILWWRTSFSR
ncbi:hypothetical protein M8J77_008496 [Diaphorina citri]|nr:hypothetical protein M8J77_008496 [Diaphorina citri]